MNLIKDFAQWIRAPQQALPVENFSDELFTAQRAAIAELMERRKDLTLKRTVFQNLRPEGRVLLEKFTRPSMVLFRQIASPTHEVLRFLTIAKHTGMHPIILEYFGDKFVSAGNQYKRALGKMPLYQHTGSDGRDLVRFHTVVDFNAYTGKPLSSVACKDGTPLIEFHHTLLNKMTRLKLENNCVDATDWFRASGGSAHEYYQQFLTLFVRDAILFEFVLPTNTEEEFAHNVIAPAFQGIENTYGMKPLVVELVPKNKATRIYWDSYPKEIQKYL